MTKTARVHRTLDLPAGLLQLLEAIAKRDKKSFSQLVSELLTAGLDSQRRRHSRSSPTTETR